MKNRKLVIFSAGIVLALIMFAGCGENSGMKEYNKAVTAWENGNLVLAKTLLQKAIRKMSGHEKKSAALNQLGLIHWQLDETESAAEAFSKSCNMTESITGANLNQGIALFHSGQYEEAEIALNNVLGENPKDLTAQAMLGMIQMKYRNWAGASQELSQTVSIAPSDPAGQNAYALTELHKNRNSDAAVKRLNQIVSTHPDYAPAAYNLAVIYEQWLHDTDLAKKWYFSYLSKAGRDGSHVDNARKALARLGDPNASAGIPKADTQAAARYMAEGANLYKAKKYKEAVVAYQKAIEADSRYKGAYSSLGSAYLQLKKYSDAAQATKAEVRLNPNDKNALYNLSLAYYYLKNWKEAERAAESLKKLGDPRGEQMLNYIDDARKL